MESVGEQQVEGEKRVNRKEKILMGMERTSNGHKRMNQGSGGREIYEELVLKEQEGES